MALQLMKIKAGVVKDITNYSAGKNGPFWIDSNLVRFINGYAEKIGGWQKDTIYGTDTSNSADYTTETSLDGIARNILFWRAESDGEDRIIVGSHSHLYVIENGVMYDDQPKYVVEFLNGNKKGMRFIVDAELVFTEDEYVYNYTTGEEFYYWYKKCQLFKEI